MEPSAPQICTSFLFLKQPIHFPLFVIPDIFNRESILLFPGHLLVVGIWSRLHLFSQRQRPSGYLLLPGFAPAAEVLLFRQKDPKPCWPWCGSSGPLRGSPTPAARKLPSLKQCAPCLRCRLHCSATPQGPSVSGGLEVTEGSGNGISRGNMIKSFQQFA